MTQVWVNWVAVWDVGWAHTPKKGKPERERERLGVPSSPDQAPAPQASMACRSAPVEREAMAAAAAPAAEPELSPEPQQQQDIEPEKANEQPMEQDKNTEQQDGDTEQQDDAEAEQQDKQQDEQEENQQDQIIKGLEAARAKLKEKITTYKKEQVRVTNELHKQHVLVVMLKSQNKGLKEQLELLKSEHANWREYESLKGTSTSPSKNKLSICDHTASLDTGHWVIIEHPDEFHSILLDWLASSATTPNAAASAN
eukprot:m51a1_g9573 hypothetical protein (255) ;mRNA; r:926370-931929